MADRKAVLDDGAETVAGPLPVRAEFTSRQSLFLL